LPFSEIRRQITLIYDILRKKCTSQSRAENLKLQTENSAPSASSHWFPHHDLRSERQPVGKLTCGGLGFAYRVSDRFFRGNQLASVGNTTQIPTGHVKEISGSPAIDGLPFSAIRVSWRRFAVESRQLGP
jgi:hypothetical protein